MKKEKKPQKAFEFDDSNCCYSAKEDIVTQMAKFVIERHNIYLRKSSGSPAPWTKDPILQSFRFCNIYRELDTVTVWIRQNIIEKYQDNPNLWFMLCIARIINWPDTLQEMMDKGVWPVESWNANKAYKVLAARADRGEKVITGAYLINSIFPIGYPVEDNRKVCYIPKIALDPMWKDRNKIQHVFKQSFEDAATTIMQYHGWANFLSYQVTVDLSYSDKWLGNAPDYNTFNLAGPGTIRGLKRYFTGSVDGELKKSDLPSLIVQQRKELNARIHDLLPAELKTGNFETGLTSLSLSNDSNANCEFDKHQRIFLSEGQMRCRYEGR